MRATVLLAALSALAAIVVPTGPGAGDARAASGQVASGSPAGTVRSFLRLVTVTGGDLVGACELLSADARDGLSGEDVDCPGMLAMVFYYQGDTGQDRLPEYRRTAVGAVRVVRHAGLTIVRVRLRHHFAPERGQPRSVGAVATVPVVHEPGGWRVATPLTLMPAAALEGGSTATSAQLRAHLTKLTEVAGEVRAARAARAVATTTVGAAEPCAGPVATAGDPKNDVEVGAGGYLAERQDAAHVDVLAIRHARAPVPCFEIALRTALPDAFGVELDVIAAPGRRPPEGSGEDEMRVEVAGAHVLGSVDDPYDDADGPAHVIVGLSPDRRTLTVRPDPAALWRSVPPASAYRWRVTVSERGAEEPYADRVPGGGRIEARTGAPAPPSAPAWG